MENKDKSKEEEKRRAEEEVDFAEKKREEEEENLQVFVEEQEEEEEERRMSSGLEETNEKKMALSDDATKVKFINSNNSPSAMLDGHNNGDAKVDIENVQIAFAGMGKEELLKYADDPFWVRLRWIFFALFWIVWLAMLVGAIVIVVRTPGCPPLPTREWWQKGPIYHVSLPSFKDSNGDGRGDIKGIETKLDYFNELGVNTVWLSPIYKSPMADFGYDISDYEDIDPSFGTLQDFKSFLTAAKAKGLKVVLDFVPNHSSDQHPWFEKSRNREGNYSDYYIWADGSGQGGREHPPNNWVSCFDGSGWTYDEVRGQFFFHQFLPQQPDLNFRNPAVREEIKNVLKFWLDLGVDGFRVDALKHLIEVEDLRDEPRSNVSDAKPTDYTYLNHIYTTDLPELFDVVHEWRLLLDSYEEKDGNYRVMMTEVYDPLPEIMMYYGNDTRPLADLPFNFELIFIDKNTSASDLYGLVKSYLDAIPKGKWPNWVLGNHDRSRIATRVGEELVDAFNMLSLLLGGTQVTYYGEEIGMHDVFISFEETQDPKGKSHGEVDYLNFSRDFERTPMQWDNGTNAGFTTAKKPWLRVADDYVTNNVEAQRSNANSHLNVYKKLVQLREEPAVMYGDRCFLFEGSRDVFAFARVKKGSPGYAVLANFGSNSTVLNLVEAKGCNGTFNFPADGIVEVKSINVSPTSPLVGTKSGSKVKVPLNDIPLGAKEAVVVKFVPAYPG